MVRIYWIWLLLVIATTGIVKAQQCPYPDSLASTDELDPVMYWPLAVGNIWEYEVRTGDSLRAARREEVVGYAIFKNVFYYRLDSRVYHPEADSALSLTSLLTDYITVTDSSVVKNGSISPVERDVRFNAPFQSCYTGAFVDSVDALVSVSGIVPDFVILREGGIDRMYPTPASKSFNVEGDTSAIFAHGFGLVEANGESTQKLVYTRIGATEFGTPLADLYAIPTNVETINSIRRGPDVYPVPATNEVTVSLDPFRTSTGEVVIYDILGRRVWVNHSKSNGSLLVRVDVSDWTNGVYVLSISGLKERHVATVVVSH